MERFIKRVVEENITFILGKLNKDTKNPFFASRERFLLQGFVGVFDELQEVAEAKGDIEKLAELGDVLFYLILASNAICAWKERSEAIMMMQKTVNVGTVTIKKPINMMVSIGKKIAFQGREDLVDRFCVTLGLVWRDLAQKYSEEEMNLSIALMRYKLSKRYGNKFSAQASKNRRDKEEDTMINKTLEEKKETIESAV